MELFFAKLFGLYFIIVGGIILVRRSTVIPTVRHMAEERALLLLIAVVEIAAGLGIILAFPGVAFDLAGLISLIGYMLVVEGILYLAAPTKLIRKFIAYFNKPTWYVVGGLLSVAAGIYLAGRGFGYF